MVRQNPQEPEPDDTFDTDYVLPKSSTTNWAQQKAEIAWLAVHSDFAARPATIREFVGPEYLALTTVRAPLMEALVEIFGETVDSQRISLKRKACFTGGIGIGKSFTASVALTYMVHWVSCLKNPQHYFGLADGSRISFMLMSTSENRAKDVIFGDVKARVENSPWFQKWCKYDKKWLTQLRFPRKIWIVPGGCKETQFEGYNILAGIVDEGDSYPVTEEVDNAENGWNAIDSRIASRYVDHVNETHRGLIIAIGQRKSLNGFMQRRYEECLEDQDGSATLLTIWESYGWYNYTEDKQDIKRQKETSPRRSFYFDTVRKEILPDLAAGMIPSEDQIEIPLAFIKQFSRDPVKALKDLAGIPPKVDDPFISSTYMISAAQDRWEEEFGDNPISGEPDKPVLAPWFRCNDQIHRTVHIDIAYSPTGDAMGLAMGHISHLQEDPEEGEWRPYVCIDCAIRWKAKSGKQNSLEDMRSMVYTLRARGFNIKSATFDGFNSIDSIQQFNKKKIQAWVSSIDKTKEPYETLRDAIYEERISFPRYTVQLNHSNPRTAEIIDFELSGLQDVGRKIDHSASTSKDVADCIAGVSYTLMRRKSYRNGAPRRNKASVVSTHTEPTPEEIAKLLSGGGAEQNPAMVPSVSFDTFSKMMDQNGGIMQGVSVPYDAFDLREQWGKFNPEPRYKR